VRSIAQVPESDGQTECCGQLPSSSHIEPTTRKLKAFPYIVISSFGFLIAIPGFVANVGIVTPFWQ